MVQEFLEDQICEIEKKITKIAEIEKKYCIHNGNIVYHAGKRPYFRISTGSKGQSQLKYLSKKDIQTINNLANKKYSHELLPVYVNTAKALKTVRDLYIVLKTKTNNYFYNFPIKHESSMLPAHIIAEKWAAAEYETNIMEGKLIITRKGEKVRSRAEAIIADWLYGHNIPYRYENLLKLKNTRHHAFPDFTVMDPETLKITYIEYFGIMSDPDYVTNTRIKIDDYALNGITIGNNFLPLFEFENRFNSSTIEKTLAGYFLR